MNNRRIAPGARVTQYKYTAFISKCRIFVHIFFPYLAKKYVL